MPTTRGATAGTPKTPSPSARRGPAPRARAGGVGPGRPGGPAAFPAACRALGWYDDAWAAARAATAGERAAVRPTTRPAADDRPTTGRPTYTRDDQPGCLHIQAPWDSEAV